MSTTRLEDIFKDWNPTTITEIMDNNSSLPDDMQHAGNGNQRKHGDKIPDKIAEVNNYNKLKDKDTGKSTSQELLPLKKDSSEEEKSVAEDCLPCKKPSLLPIILFVANCGGLILFFMMMMIYTGGVIRTIERRFGLRSQQTGVLSSLNDITHICIVVFIGYLARKGNKPRMISATIIFSSIGGFFMAAPYFIYPDVPTRPITSNIQPSSPGHNLYTNGSHASHLTAELGQSKHQFCQLGKSNGSDECWTMNEEGQKVATTAEGIHPAYTFFVIAQLISGVGSSSVFTLSLAYIDENTPRDKSSVFLGLLTSLYSFGPLCGFMLAGLTLRLPENLGSTPTDTPDDPTWIGNWWLGYIICSIALIILAIPMWFFPKTLASAPPPDPSRNTGSRREVHGVVEQMKEFPRDLMHLMRNKLFLVNLVSVVCGAYIVMGIFTNLVRYIEIHFLERAFVASIIAALVLALAGGIGGLVGGLIMHRFKLTPSGALKLMIFSNASFICGCFIVLMLGCPQVQMGGNVNPSNGLIDVNMQCNAGCSCSTSRKAYSPVCGKDDVTYFSSCFGGCKDFVNGTYTGCSCIEGGMASPGLCRPYCGYLIPFAVTLFTACVLASLARVPATIVNFRIVDDDERSFALGMNSFAINLLGFIPAPILYGSLIDSSCRLWQSTCGKSGACLLFDTARFRNVTYGTSLGFQIVDVTFVVILFILVRRSDRMKRVVSLSGANNDDKKVKEEKKSEKITSKIATSEKPAITNGDKIIDESKIIFPIRTSDV